MLALGIILMLLAAVFVFLLFSPFQLYLDTTAGLYFLSWKGIASARLTGPADDPVIRIWVLGWRKRFRLLDMAGTSEKKEDGVSKKRGKGRKKRPRWFSWRLGLRLLRTFRVRELRLLLDTGDYVRNAYLFPVFSSISGGSRQLAVNFSGRNELVLNVTNRAWDVLRVFLVGIFSSKK